MGADVFSGIVGMIIALIFFVIGIVWLIFPFIVNSWLRKIHSEIAATTNETRLLNQEAAKANQQLLVLLSVNRQTSKAVTKKTSPVEPPQPPQSSQTYSISQNGQNIGEYTVPNIKQMLRDGRLTYQDMWFDTSTQEWVTLDLHPTL